MNKHSNWSIPGTRLTYDRLACAAKMNDRNLGTHEKDHIKVVRFNYSGGKYDNTTIKKQSRSDTLIVWTHSKTLHPGNPFKKTTVKDAAILAQYEHVFTQNEPTVKYKKAQRKERSYGRYKSRNPKRNYERMVTQIADKTNDELFDVDEGHKKYIKKMKVLKKPYDTDFYWGDDPIQRTTRSWKHYRKTQYKTTQRSN